MALPKFPLAHYLSQAHIRERVFYERLTEPFHLNIMSAFVAMFGSMRKKIAYDLVPMQHYAFGIAKASEFALRYGMAGVSLLEFGVAAGRGCRICATSRPA